MRFWRMILLCLFGSYGKSEIDSISNTLFSFSKGFQTVIFNPFFFGALYILPVHISCILLLFSGFQYIFSHTYTILFYQ